MAQITLWKHFRTNLAEGLKGPAELVEVCTKQYALRGLIFSPENEQSFFCGRFVAVTNMPVSC